MCKTHLVSSDSSSLACDLCIPHYQDSDSQLASTHLCLIGVDVVKIRKLCSFNISSCDITVNT